MRNLISDAVEVKGSDDKKYKKEKLLGFGRGEFRVLITKLKIAQFGLNYQNCHNQIFASLDFSFESTYQGIRRSYRFGQELIAKWANDNFMKPRQPRQPQLWIWSRQPEMGKTYPWAIIMRKYFNCYEWIYGPKQGKEILSCDYILIDELKGGITITELKSLSQMYGMNLDIKYGAPTFFNKNVPLIITSNLPPSEIYHKCKKEDLESLESRFLIVNVDEACHLEPLQEPIVEPTFELTPMTTRHLLGSPTRQTVS